MSDRLLTLDAAADQLGVSARTLRREITAGRLAVIRIGRSVRVDPVDIRIYKRGISDDPGVNTLLSALRHRARKRGIESSLTHWELEYIRDRAAGHCEVTGIKFTNEYAEGARMRPWIPSVDRIDCSQGYHFPNCRLVCAYVNLVLYDYGDAMFEKLARAFIARRDGKP